MYKKRFVRAYIKFLKRIRFKNLALRQKIIFVHILLLIIPLLLLYSFVLNIYINGKKDEVLNSMGQVGQIAMSNIDNYVQQIEELTKQPLYDTNVLSTLIESDKYIPESDAALENAEDNTGGRARNRYSDGEILEDSGKPVSHLASRLMAFNRYIHSVFIVDLNGRYTYSIVDNSLVKPYQLVNEDWYKKCFELNGRSSLVSTFSLNDYIEQRGNNVFIFSVARAIKNPVSTQTLGAVIINIKSSYLRDVFQSVKDGRILILDEANNIVYDSNENNIAKSVNSRDFDLNGIGTLDLSKKYNRFKLQKNKYVVISTQSGISNWRLVRVIPERTLYSGVWAVRNQLSLFLVLFVVFSLILTISISYGVTKPLNKLILTMKAIEKGDLSLRFKVRYKDEVGQLGRSFNKMINKIDNLVNIVYVSRLRKREAELQALQAQINPHFIYNTMEAIRMMAKLNGDPETSEMALILGKLLRYSINIKNKIVSVEEEVEHLKNYLIIQNYRFDNKFELIVNIEEDLYNVSIIKLVFQPVVENAIYHGLETCDWNGIILLKGYRKDGSIFFDIEDNGLGMTEEEVMEINEKANDFSTIESGDRGVGLRNINERIKLHYGEDYGINIFSVAGKGTTVRIKLPG